MSYPEVRIGNDGFTNGKFTNNKGHVWTVARLVACAKDLPVFDLPLCAVNIGASVFGSTMGNKSARELAEHVRRVQDADLDCPVMLDPDGFIMDGWHRVVKALVAGRETIKAVRFTEMPPWEYVE